MAVNSCLWPLMTASHFMVRQNEKSNINKTKGTFVEKNANYMYTMVVSKWSINTPDWKNESVIVLPFIKKNKKIKISSSKPSHS